MTDKRWPWPAERNIGLVIRDPGGEIRALLEEAKRQRKQVIFRGKTTTQAAHDDVPGGPADE